MNLRVKIAAACLMVIWVLPATAALRLYDGEVCFYNNSTNGILLNAILCDGKERFPSCGILNPDAQPTVYDERMFPFTFPHVFEIHYWDSNRNLITNKLDTGWVKLQKAKLATIYFIFTSKQQFILKIYLDTGESVSWIDGKLLPDEEDPVFKSHKELIRASIDGNAQRVRELLGNGSPCTWPNNPVSMTPLELSVRWNQKEVFDILIDRLPNDFYPYAYYNCIRMAAQDGHTTILKRLLENDLARNVPDFPLQQIFYGACDHLKTDPARTNDVEVVKMLLEHFKVGIDFQTSDYGHTLLFGAANSGDIDLATWLLAQGANPNAKLQNGETPLGFTRNEDMKSLLREHGGQ
jgi:hypothetical protein